MSPRSGLPTPFLVGILSTIALGLAWALVYISLPTPPASVAVNPPTAHPEPPSIPSHEAVISTPTPDLSPVPPTTSQTPAESSMNGSPEQRVLQTFSGQSKKPVEKPESTAETEQAGPAERTETTSPTNMLSKPSKPAPPMGQPPATEPPIVTGLSPLTTEEGPALQGISPACIVELEKLCEGVQAGGARRKCFKDNEEKLSPACQRQFDDMAARIKEDMQHFRTACAGDIKQFCPDVQPGGGSIVQCLEDNYKEVSENCYHALKRFRKMKSGRSL